MKRNKFMAFSLATVMALNSTIGAFAADMIDCPGFLSTYSEGYLIDEDGFRLTFDSVTYDTATASWCSPMLITYAADEPEVGGDNYHEYAVIRSDYYMWGYADDGTCVVPTDTESLEAAGYKFEREAICEDWDTWLAENKKGVKCSVNARYEGEKVVIEFTNNGLTSTTTIPVDSTRDVYVSLTGELCTISNIVFYDTCEYTATDAPTGESTSTDVPTGESTSTDAPTGESTSTDVPGTTLDCPGYWGGYIDGYLIDEDGLEITYTNTTYSSATDPWNGPMYSVYTSDDGKHLGNNYRELLTMRSDVYGWTQEGYNTANSTSELKNAGYVFGETTGIPSDWSVWVAEKQAGVSGSLKAIRNDDGVIVEFANNGLTSRMLIPVASGQDAYVLLTGDNCTYTNISVSQTCEDIAEIEPGSQEDEKFVPEILISEEVTNTDVPIVSGESLNCEVWWTAHSAGYEIDEDGILITFDSITTGTATWNVPIYVLYAADEAFAGGAGIVSTAGYEEIFVMRGDNYGWSSVSGTGTGMAEQLEQEGFVIGEATGLPADNDEWKTWLEEQQAGTSGMLKAIKADGYVVVEFTSNGLTSRMLIPADTKETLYVSLTGEYCNFTNICVYDVEGKLSENAPVFDDDNNDKTPGDDFDVPDQATDTDAPVDGGSLDCYSWWENHTAGYPVDEDGITVTYTNTTYSSATCNWNTPIYVVYTADKKFEGGYGIANVSGYSELLVMRSDAYGWAGAYNTGTESAGLENAGYVIGDSTGVPASDSEWQKWLDGHHTGAAGKLSAIREDGYVKVSFTNNGLTSNMAIPVEDGKQVYISLTGELCTLTDIQLYGLNGDNDTTIPDLDEGGDGDVDVPDQATDTDAPVAGGSLDCYGWWVNHTAGYPVDKDGITVTYTNTTYSSATNIWNVPVYVVYTADEGFDGGEGIFNTAGYSELFVMRADNYGWVGACNTGVGLEDLLNAGYAVGESTGVPASEAEWQAWLDGHHAGAAGRLRAIREDGYVKVSFTNNGLTSNMTIPVADGKQVYISLSGELCTLTDIQLYGVSGAVPTPNPDQGEQDTPEDDSTVLDCPGWWTEHTKGYAIDKEGITIEYDYKCYDSATALWNGPNYIVYTADEPFMGGTTVNNASGYNELLVMRYDCWGWAPNGLDMSNISAMEEAGYIIGELTERPEAEEEIAKIVAANRAGAKGFVKAIRTDGYVTITFSNNNMVSVISIPVDNEKDVYVSLGGELCTLSNIHLEGKELTITGTTSETTIEQGDSVTISGAAAGGDGDYTYSYLVYNKTAKEWTRLTSEFVEDAAYTWTAENVGTYLFYVEVKDDAETVVRSTAMEVTVTEPALPLSITGGVNADTVEQGCDVIISGQASGGKEEYTYSYLVYSKAANAWTRLTPEFVTDAAYTWNAENVGVYRFYVEVKDSEGTLVRSTAIEVTVTEPVLPLAITGSVSADTVEQGKTIVISGEATGGKAEYTYSYLVYNKTANKWTRLTPEFVNDATYTWTAESMGTYLFYVEVKDSEGTLVRSAAVNVTVTAPALPLAIVGSANAESVELGENVIISGEATGGVKDYTYSYLVYYKTGNTWTRLTPLFITSNAYGWTAEKVGTYLFYVEAKDGEGTVVRSEAITLTVTEAAKPLAITGKASVVSVVKGKKVTITGTANGGKGDYTYSYLVYNKTTNTWARLTPTFKAGNTFTWTAGSAGTRVFYVEVKDSTGKVVRSAPITVTVTEEVKPLAITAKASVATATKGTKVTITGTATGGEGGYTYSYLVYNKTTNTWARLTPAFKTGNTFTWTAGSAGTRMFYVEVKDSTGKLIRSKATTVVVK